MNIQLTPVTTSRHKNQFIDFPHDLYAGDPNYVPEIHIGQQDLLNPKKNPFFLHSKVQLFLAEKDGKVAGRIAAIRNNNYNEYAGTNAGFFGFFDVVEDYAVAKALLDAAADWVKNEGLESLLGPANFSTNDTAGLLVEGFDRPPVVMMVYNKPYYKDFLEKYGFTKQMDMLAYFVDKASVNQKSLRLANMIGERLAKRGITVRTVNMKKFADEIKKVREVYRGAWDKNWGFVPPTDAEFDHLAKDMKMILDSDFALLAEHEGNIVAFALAIPDINIITRTMRRGRLFPTGIFKLLLRKNKLHRMRIILLGVLEGYRRLGIEGVFYARIIGRGMERGFTEAEASWILDNNEMMKKGVESVNMTPYKRYRMYEKIL